MGGWADVKSDLQARSRPGSEASAKARLTMLCCHDGSPRPLTQKIVERPRLVQRIREAIPDPMRAYLTVFNSTPLERKLSVLLGIPLNGLDPDLQYYGTKSGSRRVFCEAGVPCPDGYEDLRGADLAGARQRHDELPIGELADGVLDACAELGNLFDNDAEGCRERLRQSALGIGFAFIGVAGGGGTQARKQFSGAAPPAVAMLGQEGGEALEEDQGRR